MDGGITEGIRDLRKVCLFLSDHLFCFLDFQIRKVVDHPAVLFFLKELLQLGFSNKIRLADLIEGQLAVQMIFHIQKDPLVEDGIVFFPGGFFGRIRLFFLFEAAKHRQEKQFQIKLDHLFRGKGCTGAPFHFLGKGVIERRCDAVAGLADDLSEKRFFRLTDGGDEVAELFHTGGIAGKGNHDKIGSNLSVCFYIMKFVRFMKDDLPLLQGQFFLSGGHRHLALVHAKKFPEIMGLPVKMIGVGIFKIMDGDNLCNVQFFGQRERLVSHGSSTPFTGKMSNMYFMITV